MAGVSVATFLCEDSSQVVRDMGWGWNNAEAARLDIRHQVWVGGRVQRSAGLGWFVIMKSRGKEG